MATTTAPTAPPATPATDWRLAIPESRRRWLRGWFWSIAAFTLAVLIVGGITRLTRSGLSIVEWNPIMGVIPPLGDAQWQEAFDRYRQFPEYQQLRRGMSLQEFKFIFFWEYIHRVLARLIGVVFLVPFVFFAVRRWFNRPLAGRSLLLFGLGASQGLMGWLMVQSGLVDRPSVSHFRLAAHLSLAFLICGCAVWLARELSLQATRAAVSAGVRRTIARGLALTGAVLALQIVWGAFVAGLKAGFIYNTFPLMGGRWVPAALGASLLDFVQHPAAVQWLHRVLGTVLVLVVAGYWFRLRQIAVDACSLRYAAALLAVVAGQYLLGVVTLLYSVPIPLGVAHQATALVVFALWVAALHHARNLRPARA